MGPLGTGLQLLISMGSVVFLDWPCPNLLGNDLRCQIMYRGPKRQVNLRGGSASQISNNASHQVVCRELDRVFSCWVQSCKSDKISLPEGVDAGPACSDVILNAAISLIDVIVWLQAFLCLRQQVACIFYYLHPVGGFADSLMLILLCRATDNYCCTYSYWHCCT